MSEDEVEVDIRMRRTTCHTPGCENEGIGLEWECTPNVVCGPCGKRITDVVIL